jgi:hypothetical protein
MNNTPKLQPASTMGHLAKPQPLIAAPSLLATQKLLHGTYDMAGKSPLQILFMLTFSSYYIGNVISN